MQRVLVLGSSGSGKSTFARKLGEITGLPVVHLDQLFWEPGWVQAPKPVYLERLHQALAQDRGSSTATIHRRSTCAAARRPDHPVGSLAPCVPRAGRMRIAMSYGQVRPDMAPGCPEKIDWEFLKYVWNFPNRHWPGMLAAIDRHTAWDRATTLKSDPRPQPSLQPCGPARGKAECRLNEPNLHRKASTLQSDFRFASFDQFRPPSTKETPA